MTHSMCLPFVILHRHLGIHADHQPPSVSVDYGLFALVVVWCRGDVTTGTASAVAGQSDSAAARISTASSVGVGGCWVVFRGARFSSGSLFPGQVLNQFLSLILIRSNSFKALGTAICHLNILRCSKISRFFACVLKLLIVVPMKQSNNAGRTQRRKHAKKQQAQCQLGVILCKYCYYYYNRTITKFSIVIGSLRAIWHIIGADHVVVKLQVPNLSFL